MNERDETTRGQEPLPQDNAPEETADLPQAEKAPFVPSPKWKRVMAWILFAIVAAGVVLWLLNIAIPGWTDKVIEYFRH